MYVDLETNACVVELCWCGMKVVCVLCHVLGGVGVFCFCVNFVRVFCEAREVGLGFYTHPWHWAEWWVRDVGRGAI